MNVYPGQKDLLPRIDNAIIQICCYGRYPEKVTDAYYITLDACKNGNPYLDRRGMSFVNFRLQRIGGQIYLKPVMKTDCGEKFSHFEFKITEHSVGLYLFTYLMTYIRKFGVCGKKVEISRNNSIKLLDMLYASVFKIKSAIEL